MPKITFTDGTTAIVSREKAHSIQNILDGKKEPTEAQEAFCIRVKSVDMGSGYESFRKVGERLKQKCLDNK